MQDVRLTQAVPHPFGCLVLSGAVDHGEREVCLPARTEAGAMPPTLLGEGWIVSLFDKGGGY